MFENDEEKLPRFSYDLVTWLDETIGRPDFPVSANAFRAMDEGTLRAAAFTAGARSIVDMLLDIREEEITNEVTESSNDADDQPDVVFPRVLGEGSILREITPPLRVAEIEPERELDD